MEYYPVVLIPEVLKKFLVESSHPEENYFLPVPPPPQLPFWFPWRENLKKGELLVALFISGLMGAIAFRVTGVFRLLLICSCLLVLVGLGIFRYYLKYAIDDYQLALSNYQELQTSRQVAKRVSPIRVAHTRREQISLLLKDVALEQPSNASSMRTGISEGFFWKYLQFYFPGEVRWGEEVEVSGVDYNYSTDFSVVTSCGLRIDIEIDEPYAIDSKKPIHLQGCPAEARRNRFFVEHNWIVVRFAEQQIVQNPRSCCKVIASLLAQILQEERYLDKFALVPDLIPLLRWNKASAQKMARLNSRARLLAQIGKTLKANKKKKPQVGLSKD